MIVAVVGDEAGLFGRGTSGEGCDVTELRLPGVQEDLLHALADTGKPVVAVLVTGRPYAIGGVAGRLAAIVQAFFPGEEGGPAIAGVLTGRVTPSGRLPVELPAAPARSRLPTCGHANAAGTGDSSVDPTPLFAFGHGLSYTTFGYSDLMLSADDVPTDGAVEISCTVRNTGGTAADRGRAALPRRSGRVRGAAGPLAGRVHPGAAGARRGVPGGVPGARRPDLVHRPGRDADRRAGRDHRGGRRGIRQPAADVFVHALRPVARGAAPTGSSTRP